MAEIRTFRTDGMPRTTSDVYVALTDGVLPALATFQIPGTVTFR